MLGTRGTGHQSCERGRTCSGMRTASVCVPIVVNFVSRPSLCRILFAPLEHLITDSDIDVINVRIGHENGTIRAGEPADLKESE